MKLKFTIFGIIAFLFAIEIFASVNVNIQIRKPLPPKFSDWRNDPSIIMLSLTPSQNYNNVRISFSISDMDKNRVVVKTKDNSPTMPRYNLQSGVPLLLNGSQLVNEENLDINSSIRDNAVTTQMLPEGNYEFCVKLLDPNGEEIASRGITCAQSFVRIPDPPQLINPLGEVFAVIGGEQLPNFVWSPAANLPRGMSVNYILKIAPLFKGQEERQAIDNNPLLFNKSIPGGRTTYRYLPSDMPFSKYKDAVAFVWQVQAVDMFGKPATRNQGKSEIGRFNFVGKSNTKSSIVLLNPKNASNIDKNNLLFNWTKGLNNLTYKIRIAYFTNANGAENAITSESFKVFEKNINDTFYLYNPSDFLLDSYFFKPDFAGFVWQVSIAGSYDESKILPKSNTSIFYLKPVMKTMSGSLPQTINCSVSEPTNKVLSIKDYNINDKIKVGEFELTLTNKPTKDGDLYKGEGYITIPFLKNIRMAVEFNSGISINSNDELIAGTIQAKMIDGFPIVPMTGLSEADIKKYTDKSSESDRKLGFIQENTMVFLPIGIDNVIKQSPFVLSIASGKFSSTGAILDLALRYKMPFLSNTDGLGFIGRICINQSGFTGQKELMLANEIAIPNSPDSWSFKFKQGQGSDKGTYISINNNGFESLKISAELVFPRNVLIPSPDDGKNISIPFACEFSQTKEMIAEAAISQFSPAAIKDFSISANKIYIDLSSASNPSGIVYPESYTGVSDNTWQGCYINQAKLILPKQFKTSGNNQIEAIFSNLIIDETGISTKASIQNVADVNLGGFEAKITEFFAKLVSNSFTEGGFSGKIKLPISPDELDYTGTITLNSGKTSYKFSVTTDPNKGFNVPMWYANFKLDPTSSLSIIDTLGSFKAKAKLDGRLTINSKVGPVKLGFELMKFENFVVDENGINSGTVELGNPQESLSGFPVSVDKIAIISDIVNKRCGINFQLSVNLYEAVLSGSTKFTLWAKKSGNSFGFDKIELDSVTIKSKTLVGDLVSIDGGLSFYTDNPDYGDGFRGNLTATILNKIQGKAIVQFGSKLKESGTGNYRYWFVDASLISNKGFPVWTGVGIFGFGGGAFYNMVSESKPNLPGTSALDLPSGIGTTISGATLKPKEEGLGFMARVTLGTYPNATPLNGDLEIMLTIVSGGLGELKISGQGYLVSELPARSSKLGSAIASISYNFGNGMFLGNFGVDISFSSFAKASGSLEILSNNAASPPKWHIYMGTWEDRLSLEVLSLFTTQSYFMVGNDLPGGLPPFPADVKSIFAQVGKQLPMPNAKDQKMISEGQGISFGASTSFGGDYRFLIFYARLAAGLGFDLNWHKFAGVTCADGTELGINGWYLNGQMYAYVAANIGLHVDLWFVEGDFEILSGGFAAIMNGGLPNPSWAKGMVAGYYRILKGLVRGHCSFEFQVGQKCEMIVENPLAMGLISDMQPVGNDVSVFASPTATFNFPIPDENSDNHFDIQVMGADGNPGPIRTFRIKIDEIQLKNKSTLNNVEYVKGVTDEAMTLALTPKSVLEAKKDFAFRIKAHGEELVNNVWLLTKYETGDKKGQVISKDTTVNFKTGDRPNNVLDANIIYSYPAQGQRYFIPDKNRAKKGYIVVRQDQDYLFNEYEFLNLFEEYKNRKDQYKVEYLALFKYAGNKIKEVPAYYANSPSRVEFDITHLEPSRTYNVQIIGRVTPKTTVSDFSGLTKKVNKITYRKGGPKGGGISLSDDLQIGAGVSSKLKNELKNKAKTYIPKEDIFGNPGDPREFGVGSKLDINTNPSEIVSLADNKGSGFQKGMQVFSSTGNIGLVNTGIANSGIGGNIGGASTQTQVMMAKTHSGKQTRSAKNYSYTKSKTEIIKTDNPKFYYLANQMDEDETVVDTITSRTIDVTAMKTLQPNEKSLFESALFFNTSRFTSIESKMNGTNIKNSNIALNYQLYGYLDFIGEPFDEFDVKGKMYKAANQQTYIFGPFVRFKIDENTDWEKWAKFEIYDMHDGDSHWQNGDGTWAPVPIPYWFNDVGTKAVPCGNMNWTVTHKPSGQTKNCCGEFVQYFKTNLEKYDSYRENLTNMNTIINVMSPEIAFASLEDAYQAPKNKNSFTVLDMISYSAKKDLDNVFYKNSNLYWSMWNIVNLRFADYACLLTSAWTLVHGDNWNKVNMSVGGVYSADGATRNMYYALIGIDQGTAEYLYGLTDALHKYMSEFRYDDKKIAQNGLNRFEIQTYYPTNAGNLKGNFIMSKPFIYYPKY